MNQPTYCPPAQQTETWLPVAGFDDYEVSNLGRVRSLDRWRLLGGVRPHFYRGKILSPGVSKKSGYCSYSIARKENGVWKTRNRLAHRLVAIAFLPNPENKPEVNHLDGQKSGNHVSNLEWATDSENDMHAKRVLLRAVGEDHPLSKLTKDDVLDIRAAVAFGARQRVLAIAYGVSDSNISSIVRRKMWRHV